VTITPTGTSQMRRWRKHLFIALARNAASPVEYFRLPSERTVIVGSQIEL
jgi:KUP system potassium uptake protein